MSVTVDRRVFKMLRTLPKLDVTKRKGTYLVVTFGSVYMIKTHKSVAGGAVVSGGRFKFMDRTLIVVDGTIAVDDCIYFEERQRSAGRSSSVVAIAQLSDDVSDEQQKEFIDGLIDEREPYASAHSDWWDEGVHNRGLIHARY